MVYESITLNHRLVVGVTHILRDERVCSVALAIAKYNAIHFMVWQAICDFARKGSEITLSGCSV